MLIHCSSSQNESENQEVSLSINTGNVTFVPGSGWDESELNLTSVGAETGPADLSQANLDGPGCTHGALATEGKNYLVIAYGISNAFGLWITTDAENLSTSNVGKNLPILEGDGYLVITSYDGNKISGSFSLGNPILKDCVNPSEGIFTNLSVSTVAHIYF